MVARRHMERRVRTVGIRAHMVEGGKVLMVLRLMVVRGIEDDIRSEGYTTLGGLVLRA